MPARYRVLSLDLHDTVVWDTPAIVEAQYEVRLNLLAQGLQRPNGSPIPLEDLRRARQALHAQWRDEGGSSESIPLALQVEQIRQRLRARYVGSVDEVVRGYAEGGLREHPSQLNPEFPTLVRSLNQRSFPVIVLTNTSRSGPSWKSFLEDAGAMRLADVVASTDVGACKPDPRMFEEVVRRLGVSAAEVLHVGDSWDMDVEGARRSGMGAALYLGLRSHYWDPEKLAETAPSSDPSVPLLDDLSEVRALIGLG